jgi:hypothetical protein
VTTPSDLEPYERRVEPARTLLDTFAEQLVQELDEDKGGFDWWTAENPDADWRALTLLGDYLIQSIYGSAESLLAASFTAKVHRVAVYSESREFSKALQIVAKAGDKRFDAVPRAMRGIVKTCGRGITISSTFRIGQFSESVGL